MKSLCKYCNTLSDPCLYNTSSSATVVIGETKHCPVCGNELTSKEYDVAVARLGDERHKIKKSIRKLRQLVDNYEKI